VQFDQVRFYEAVDRRRQEQGLSWRQLAAELSLSPSTFSRLSQGRRPDVDTFVKVLAWLDRPATDFVEGFQSPQAGDAPKDTVRQISESLRQDSSLSNENADALEEIVRVAYHRLRGA
jgi:transcriptional regulator with XRE-family HTH domain